MAISQNPLTGKMSGSVANFVASVYRGKNVIKSKAFMPKDANSDAQKLHRGVFAMLCNEYKPLKELVDVGFPQRPMSQSPYNMFVGENMKTAIDRSSDTPVIDYAQLVVSAGTLNTVITTSVEITPEGVKVSYVPNTGSNGAPDDVVMGVVKLKNDNAYTSRKVRGSAESDSLLFPIQGVVKEDIVYIYLSVVAADGERASSTIYVKVE